MPTSHHYNYGENAAVQSRLQAEWRERAACDTQEADPMLLAAWVEPNSFFLDRCRVICETCPVRMECLEDALSDNKAEGIRGGFFFDGGTLSSEEARAMHRQLGIRVRVRARRVRPVRETGPSLLERGAPTMS